MGKSISTTAKVRLEKIGLDFSLPYYNSVELSKTDG